MRLSASMLSITFSALDQHDRIVRYLGNHEHGTLLQQAVNGGIYSYVSEQEQEISALRGQKWVMQAAEALSYIPSKGVILCDIHPNNLLLDEHLNIKFCDFAGSLFGSLDGGAMESTRFFLPRDWRSPSN